MSYILDALKKSDQERQQGTSPNLYSVHSSIPAVKGSQPFFSRYALWFIFGGFSLLLLCSVILFALYRQDVAKTNPLQTTATPSPSPQRTIPQSTPLSQPSDQVVMEKEISLSSIPVEGNRIEPQPIATEDLTPDSSTVIETETSQNSLPLLKDLSTKFQEEIPSLQFAGHTYSTIPSQRMIIINGKILRQGDLIGPQTHLAEITWEGVIIEHNGIRFRITTN